MVECLLCKQNVAGSNPTTSTSLGMYLKHLLLFENWKLEIKENYNSYNEIDNPKGLSKARKNFLLSVYGRTTDALASVGYEGRGRLR